MKKINIRRIVYALRHKYMTPNAFFIVFALIVALNWAWGALSMMERNYNLQKDLDNKTRELQLAQLETTSLDLEKRYYQTREYQELAAREDLGLALPGERVLILPPNTVGALADDSTSVQTTVATEAESNLAQWVNFLFGGNIKKLKSSN